MEAEGAKSVCAFLDTAVLLSDETHLRGTKRRRWSGDSEPGTAEVPPSAPEPQSNPLQFHHRRSSWRKSGSTWGKKTEGTFLYTFFLLCFPQYVWMLLFLFLCTSTWSVFSCMNKLMYEQTYVGCVLFGWLGLNVKQCFLPAVHWPAVCVCVCVCVCVWSWWKGKVSISLPLLPTWQWSLLLAAEEWYCGCVCKGDLLTKTLGTEMGANSGTVVEGGCCIFRATTCRWSWLESNIVKHKQPCKNFVWIKYAHVMSCWGVFETKVTLLYHLSHWRKTWANTHFYSDIWA